MHYNQVYIYMLLMVTCIEIVSSTHYLMHFNSNVPSSWSPLNYTVTSYMDNDTISDIDECAW